MNFVIRTRLRRVDSAVLETKIKFPVVATGTRSGSSAVKRTLFYTSLRSGGAVLRGYSLHAEDIQTKTSGIRQRNRASTQSRNVHPAAALSNTCDLDHCAIHGEKGILSLRSKAVNYDGVSNRRIDDAGHYGSLGRDAGHRLPGSVTSDDEGRTRLLPENGTGVRIIHDAFQSFLLPWSSERHCRESSGYLLANETV